jgi:hypothetical protein
MKKCTFVLFLLLATISVSVQQVLTTQGDSFSNAGGNIDFMIGEMIIDKEQMEARTLSKVFIKSTGTF